ncbi:glycosyltransferase family 2 protein [Pedobacter chinensis]|uniref:Glycosyltransferase family 2 protein n=1 Tax=Pedobacter chinensis TaxID=2282421 RepID=A0A369PUF2_9SPHI|nr:glycosyltransferase family 2 protein [Pedobacter chinensis]RDC54266.1 glycosyltransferase family 2 protein [Pedobacter chinensis]
MVSFIIPSYNRNSYLIQLLESVISQDYKNIEIIVVDDNSSDETESTMRNYAEQYPFIHYYRNKKNMGCGFNRGFGFNQSKGEYIVFADDDDYYTDNAFLSKCIKIFEQYDDLSFVSGLTYILIEKTGQKKKIPMNIRGYMEKAKYLENFSFKYSKPQSTFPTLFKRKSLELAGVKEMEMVNDVSIYMRMLLYGGAYILDDFIGVYRVHDNNITKSLTSDFIIENLDEKKYIFGKGKDQNVISDKNWMTKQFFLTISYFFSYSKTNISDLRKILKWGNENLSAEDAPKTAIIKSYLKGSFKKNLLFPAKQFVKKILKPKK